MTFARLLDKTLAVMRRDLLTAVRYRTGFLMTAGGVVAELAAFYYLAHAIGPGFRPEGTAYFPFLLVGTGFFTFLMMGTNSFLTSIQEAQQTGTLEVLMTSPTPAPVLVFLSAVSAFARNGFRLLVYFSVGLAVVLSGRLPHPNLPGSALIFFLSIAVAVAIGIFAASVQLAVQKGSAVVWLLGSVAWCLTGALFPISALPRPLWALAQFVPLTHSLTGMRLALLQGAGAVALAREAGILATFSAVLLPASLLVFSYTLRRARRLGPLSAY